MNATLKVLVTLLTLGLLAQQPAVAQPLPPGGPAPLPGQGGRPIGQPGQPDRPFDRLPVAPGQRLPEQPRTDLQCPPSAGLGTITLTFTPNVVKSGVPVTAKLVARCAPVQAQPVQLVARMLAGQAVVGAVNAFQEFDRTLNPSGGPRTWPANRKEFTFTFTPQRINHGLPVEVVASVDKPQAVRARAVEVSLQGPPGTPSSAPQTSSPTTGAVGSTCRPTLTLDVVPTLVTNGASVPVTIRYSCPLPVESILQVISNNQALVPGPPGGTVRVPANTTTFQVVLQAAQTGRGSATIRAVLSQPAGGASNSDSVSVTN